LGAAIGAPARTFSIGFGYPEYDELPFARIAARHFGCRAEEYVVSGDDIVTALPLIAGAYDEPFGNSSALPVYCCLQLAKRHGVRHMLAGDGGDELFAGNSRYSEHQVFEHYQHVPSFLRRGLLEPLLAAMPQALAVGPLRKARNYVAKANTPLPDRLEVSNLVRVLGPSAFIHPDLLAAIDPEAPFRDMRAVWESAPASSLVDRMLWYDWQYTLSDNDLRKVGTMGALTGVAVSYPMLDAGVVEMSMSIPSDVKMPGTQLRRFYKQAMNGYLPDAIIHKKKHGFGLPIGFWLRDSKAVRDLIHGNLDGLRARRVVREDVIDKVLGMHNSEDAGYYGVFLWVLAMLEQWFQVHGLTP
jgi:asparagine synthase (glutamine-hydrolysing)